MMTEEEEQRLDFLQYLKNSHLFLNEDEVIELTELEELKMRDS